LRLMGELRVGAAQGFCLERLRDPLWLGRCLPNLSSLEKISHGEFRAVFYLDLADITGAAGYLSRIRVDMRFTYEDAGPEQVRLKGVGRVLGSRILITVSVRVLTDAGGSVLKWSSEADLGMIQRILGEEVVRKIADRQVEALVTCLGRSLEEGFRDSGLTVAGGSEP